MLLFGSATFVLAAASFAQAAFTSFNEYIEQYALDRNVGVDAVLGIAHNESGLVQPSLVRRAPDWPKRHAALKLAIDQAVKQTAGRPHYFWSGRVFPAKSENDSVMNLALAIAQAKGGVTLEGTLKGITMPKFDGSDPDAVDIWQYASNSYTAKARGDVFVVKGESLRSGNVWEVFEYPRLKKMTPSVVTKIFEIKHTAAGPNAQRQIWPEVQGCDGVKFLEKEIKCLAGAKLYYGSQNSPRITAQTTLAKDGMMKVSASGKASGFHPECTEIMSLEWVKELFDDSGVCEAATAKGDGGKTMTKVKELLVSVNNRNYVQRNRLVKMKAKVIGPPIMVAFKSDANLLDALVSLDYYAKTASATVKMTKDIDSMVLAATGKSPGLFTAWKLKTAEQGLTKTKLRADLSKRIAQKVQEAKQAAGRGTACGTPPKPGQPATPKTPFKPSRMVRRWSTTSPVALSSLETRARTATRSGSKAAAAPSCPLKNGPKKAVVPRSKVQTKAPPKKAPRGPATYPDRKPPKATKKVAPRPATRPRRTPGKAAPRKRATPRRKPKTVPKPTRRPKGRARTRKGRRK